MNKGIQHYAKDPEPEGDFDMQGLQEQPDGDLEEVYEAVEHALELINREFFGLESQVEIKKEQAKAVLMQAKLLLNEADYLQAKALTPLNLQYK